MTDTETNYTNGAPQGQEPTEVQKAIVALLSGDRDPSNPTSAYIIDQMRANHQKANEASQKIKTYQAEVQRLQEEVVRVSGALDQAVIDLQHWERLDGESDSPESPTA